MNQEKEIKQTYTEADWITAYQNKIPAFVILNGNKLYNYYASELLNNKDKKLKKDVE